MSIESIKIVPMNFAHLFLSVYLFHYLTFIFMSCQKMHIVLLLESVLSSNPFFPFPSQALGL